MSPPQTSTQDDDRQQKPGYVYVWEYQVRSDRVAQFEEAYGPTGRWVELFKEAKGYLRTELHRDRSRTNRYLTIDYWDRAESWNTFRDEMASEFEAIDAQCEALTIEEREIGRFAPVG